MHEAEVARAIQRVLVEHLMTLANTADMPQVRAIVSQKLRQRKQRLSPLAATKPADAAHAAMLAADIKRFLDRPFAPATRTDVPGAPPGAPIGEPAMDWLRRPEPLCSWEQ